MLRTVCPVEWGCKMFFLLSFLVVEGFEFCFIVESKELALGLLAVELCLGSPGSLALLYLLREEKKRMLVSWETVNIKKKFRT